MEGKALDELMSAVAEGDNAAFERLYRETAKGIYAFAYSYLNNRGDAEDVMQQTFLQIKRKAYTYRRGTNARAWMLQIVKNLSLDELRRRKRSADGLFESGKTGQGISPPPESSALDYMMGHLTPEEREIVLLHALWGYKHREIAKQLQMPLGTVTWRYQSAVKKLERFREEV